MKVMATLARTSYCVWTMKERLWLPLVTCWGYCIDRELYNAIGYMGAMRLAPTWVVRMTCWSKLSAISRCLMA